MDKSRFWVDVSPLRESPTFRMLFYGQVISLVGRELTSVALPLQVYLLTRSSLAVGFIGLAQLGPALIMTLAGGTIADAMDRRRILLLTQVLLAGTTIGLAFAAAVPHLPVVVLFLLAAVLVAVGGLDGPARGAATRTIVRREQYSAAAALNALMRQLGAVVGPALAGVIIGRAGLALAYWIDVATYGAAILSVILIEPLPPLGGGRPAGWASLREGIVYLRRQPILQGVLLIDADAMIFGMPRALFPALGLTVFGGGAQTVGWLYAAPAVGALIGAGTSGWVSRIRRQGWTVLWVVALWGAAITVFGLTSWLPLALAMLALAGWSDIISEVLRSSILQLAAPDALRGRVTAVWLAQTNSTPLLGDIESGAVAALTTPQISATSGGVACIAGALALAWLLPAFRTFRFKDGRDEHASS